MIYLGTKPKKIYNSKKNRFVIPNTQFCPKLAGHYILYGALFEFS